MPTFANNLYDCALAYFSLYPAFIADSSIFPEMMYSSANLFCLSSIFHHLQSIIKSHHNVMTSSYFLKLLYVSTKVIKTLKTRKELTNIIIVALIQVEIINVDILLVSVLFRNKEINDNRELKKESPVEINNLSIIFISVPKFSIILTNLCELEEGINEKLAKNIAVTIAEKEREADIISV